MLIRGARRRWAAAARPANPWRPWADYGPPPVPLADAGRVLAVIPTAGRDLSRLGRCLDALLLAGGGQVDPVVVLCPPDERAAVAKAVRGKAKLIVLPAPFNFCRSTEAGKREAEERHGYILTLNDDCEWRTPGGLARLKETLRTQGWAMAGPRLVGPGSGQTQERVTRLFCPAVGACILWQRERMPSLDERFGEGWGLDEADQALRVLQAGGTWGVDGTVVAYHAHHATFGGAYTRTDGPAYQTSLARWREKWGELPEWGPWEPLPGVHVAIAGHNVAPWLQRALESTAAALRGFRWVLSYADDGSTDGSLDVACEWADAISAQPGGADRVNISLHPKGANAAEAKNRALVAGMPHHERYPALLLMDADDVMPEARARGLLWPAVQAGAVMAHGDFRYVGEEFPWRHGQVIGANETQQLDGWLHPCSTVIHRSLIPADGRLFDETMPICEDAWLWLQWWRAGVRSLPVPGAAAHEYHLRRGSVMLGEETDARMAVYERRRRELLLG